MVRNGPDYQAELGTYGHGETPGRGKEPPRYPDIHKPIVSSRRTYKVRDKADSTIPDDIDEEEDGANQLKLRGYARAEVAQEIRYS